MKTIENLNITSLSLREHGDLYGSGKEYTKRIGLPVDDEFNKRLKIISNEIGVKPTEIVRQAISILIIKCEDLINENDY